MKKLLVATLVLISFSVQAQKKPVTKAKASSQTGSLKNLTDSASYAIGLSVANFYKQQGFKNLNTTLIAKAISDVQGSGKVLMNEEVANEAIMFYINPNLRKNIDEGKKFLATNRSKTGMRTTASGIQYEVLKEGAGAKPKSAQDTVVVNYVGRLLNGTEFDNSERAGKPIEFALNRVIKGWTEGLQLMSPGAKYKFYIPHHLAYGVNDNGPIPGGATLVFEVELLDIKPAK